MTPAHFSRSLVVLSTTTILLLTVCAFVATGCGGGDPVNTPGPDGGNGGANGGNGGNNGNGSTPINSGNPATNNSNSSTPTGPPAIPVPDAGFQAAPFSKVGPLQLQRILNGYTLRHTRSVIRVRISSDNKWIASASEDGSIRVWQLSSGREVRMMCPGQKVGLVTDLTFSPDGQRLLIGFADRIVEWHLGYNRYRWVPSNSPITALSYLGGDVLRVGAVCHEAAFEWTFTPVRKAEDAGVAVTLDMGSPSAGGQTQPSTPPGMLPLPSPQRFGLFRGTMASFSADGSLLAVVSVSSNQVLLVATTPGWPQRRKSVPLGDDGVRALDLTPSGHRLTILHEKISRLSIYNDQCDPLASRDVEPIVGINASRNGHELWSWDATGKFRRRSVDNANERATFGTVIKGVTSVVGSTGERLVVGTSRGEIFVFDTDGDKRLLPADPFATITCLDMCTSGTHIAAGTQDGTVRVVTVADGTQPMPALHLPSGMPVEDISLADDGTIVLATTKHTVTVHNVVSNSTQFTRDVVKDGRRVSAAAISANGRMALIGLRGAAGAAFEIWDTIARTMVTSWGEAGPDDVGGMNVAFSPTGNAAIAVAARSKDAPAPYTVTFLSTIDITAIRLGQTIDLTTPLTNVGIGDDGQGMGLAVSATAVQTLTISPTEGVQPVATVPMTSLPSPCMWTSDKHWVFTGSAGSSAFTLYDAWNKNTIAGWADMSTAWDQARLVTSSYRFEGSQRVSHDVVVVTGRNAILHYRVVPDAGSGDGNR
ncbi:MAG: hypothetical protein AB7K09_14340 [Planctomycetota bacterium]